MPGLLPLSVRGRVLLVEDDDGARELFAQALRLSGCQVRTAENGLSGLRILDAFDADVVVLDLSLPLASGFEVLHELRASPRTREVPVIAISGHDRGIQLARANPEFFEALAKPFEPDALVRLVATALMRQRS